MPDILPGTRHLCRDGYTRRVVRDWEDGTIGWIVDPLPVVPLGETVGACTPEAFVAMLVEVHVSDAIVLRDRCAECGATTQDEVGRMCRAHPAESCDGMYLREGWTSTDATASI